MDTAREVAKNADDEVLPIKSFCHLSQRGPLHFQCERAMLQIQSLARRFTMNEDISANNSPEVDFIDRSTP